MVFSMLSVVEFELGAEDRHKRIRRHIHALCAIPSCDALTRSICRAASSPILRSVHSATLFYHMLVMRQTPIHSVTILL